MCSQSELSIKPRRDVSKVEILKGFARSFGLDPERMLVKDTPIGSHRTVVRNEEMVQIHVLSECIRDWL